MGSDHHVQAERHRGDRRRPAPAPARRAAGGARRHVTEGRLRPVGPVRVLHRPGRRQGGGQLQPAADPHRGHVGHDPRGHSDDRRAELAAAFAATGALQCGFCTPGILVRVAKSCSTRRERASTASTAARHLGAHLCRCTGYVKILDAIELLARGERPTPVGARRGRDERHASTRAPSSRWATRTYIDDLRVDGMLHAALRLADHARADVLRIDTAAAEAVPGVVRGVHRGRRPRRAAGRPHPQGLAGVHPRGRPHVVPRRRARHRRGRGPGDGPRGRPSWSRSTTSRWPPITDPVAALDDTEDAVWGLDGNVLSPLGLRPRRRRRGPRASPHTSSTRCSRPSGSSTPSSSRSRRSRCRGHDGAPPRVLRRAGRVGRPRPDRVGPRRRSRRGHRRAGLQRRGLRRQGGHGEPGPDGAGRLAARPPGQVHAHPRGVAAASTPSATRSASSTRPGATPRAASPRCGPAWSATPGPTPRWA